MTILEQLADHASERAAQAKRNDRCRRSGDRPYHFRKEILL